MSTQPANATLSYSEDAKGWPSFYSFLPDYMCGMNGFFYSWSGGNLYRHNTNEVRNNYYGVQYESSITSVFNVEPMSIKLFKTMSYESNDSWECSELFTDLSLGEMPGTGTPPPPWPSTIQTWFVQKEGEWFTFLRNRPPTNVAEINWRQRSVQGIGAVFGSGGPVGAVLTTFGGAIIANPINVNGIVSVGDQVYRAGTNNQTGVVTTPPVLLGTITNIVPNFVEDPATGALTRASITLDCSATGITPAFGDYLVAVKPAVAESYGARGYFMHFTLKNYTTTAVELFSVGSRLMKSYP